MTRDLTSAITLTRNKLGKLFIREEYLLVPSLNLKLFVGTFVPSLLYYLGKSIQNLMCVMFRHPLRFNHKFGY